MVASYTSQGSLNEKSIVVGADNLQTRQITLLSGQNLLRGSVLGKITASGKYVLSLTAASDGSQVPAVILAEDGNATGGDLLTPAYFGGVFDENALNIGSGHTKGSIREALRDYGIKLQSSIVS